ncbi:helix-turn-helix domain-containing protein [Pelomonas sp. KK5]|uniref:helix-turn-helix transcriptional regulator n=1 Tax=Pelomonas sp. KK5 TaxID=1855730 RepID=UPI00097C0DEA|nr:helix-turn-helix domain-containing protein [Pelomonas sp. KK5]
MNKNPTKNNKDSSGSAAVGRRRTRFALALDAEGIEQVAALGGHVGQPEFYPAAVSFMRALIDAEVGIALHYAADQRPQYVCVQADAARKRGAREAVYIDGPYVLDPVYQMIQRGQADGAYAMASYVPDDFYRSEFYECFFRNTRLVDTIDVLWRIDARSTMSFCLGREEGTPPFGEAELALVRHVLPLLFAVMRRHHEIAAPPAHDEVDRLVHRKVESTMANFGASLLTKREREVLFYMLSGYSSEQTAVRLHTAEGTIRNQRKSIHRKLETGSQAELFSLFIQCIPFADPESDQDPLVRYQGPKEAD